MKRACVTTLALLAAGVSCSTQIVPVGGLMLVMRTDGSLAPDQLRVEVTSSDGTKTFRSARYGIPTEVTLPTTLAIASDGDPSDSVVIDVSVWAGSQPVDLRQNEVFQIPTERVAELDVVFSATCMSEVSLVNGGAVSNCKTPNTTCSPAGGEDGGEGQCVSNVVNATQLPTFMGDAGNALAPPMKGGAPDATVPEGGVDSTVASGGCTPRTCADYPANSCGPQSDGCGGLTVNCGTCTSPEYCGGASPGVCSGNDGMTADGATFPVCVPATCQSLGYDCGRAADGCGGTIGPCGPACILPDVCGGGGSPNLCGSNLQCTGLCTKQVACDGGKTTTLTGVVRAGLQEGGTAWTGGATPDPVPGVLVYIPTTAVAPFDSNPNAPQVQCTQCGADVSGNPLLETTTAYDGTFTLQNVPVSTGSGDTIPIVIQLGHWRRQYAFPIANACATNALPQALNLPSTSAEGDIPLTAISTGNWDAIECVLLKMGVSQSEFTSFATWNAEDAGSMVKPGRVHIYTSHAAAQPANNSGPGALLAPQEDETVLMGSGTTPGINGNYMMYDQILLPCWGAEFKSARSSAELANLISYGNGGGHFFATHYSYVWLNGNGALNNVANWDIGANVNTNNLAFTGVVSRTVPPVVPVANPGTFVTWLNYVQALSNETVPPALSNPADVTIQQGRHDVDTPAGTSTAWITGTDPTPGLGDSSNMLLHFTFDMPVESTADSGVTQCGHGIFSDFHVTVSGSVPPAQTTFPAECMAGPMTSQERILEYMIWDLASCVPAPPMVPCMPKTCADYPAATCGPQTDGCSGLTLACNPCPGGQTCGGAGAASRCGAPGVCTPQGCPASISCGPAGDGCGGVIASCGTCATPQRCGGGAVPGQCGNE